jgi:glycosyltransferase involved in cell wall biosynthesis
LSETTLGNILILTENESVPHDRRVWQISRTLTQAGFQVTIVCPCGEGSESSSFDKRDGVEIHRYRPRPAHTGGALAYAREYAWAFLQTWRLVRRLSRGRFFDVVHACNPPDFLLFTALSLKRRGARFIFDHHDVVPELYLARFGQRRGALYFACRALERATFQLADVVLATNASYREIALRRGRKRADDVFIVRNAPDPSRFTPRSPDPTLKHGFPHLIAYVGVMGEQDGVDHALGALAALKKRREDWSAVFVGDGDAVPTLRRLVGELDLDGFVRFTGWLEQDDVVHIIASSDVCLSPEPKNELNDVSTMVKVAEYMALGRPVVAYDLRETRFTAGEAALYAVPSDPESFAERIDELLSDPEQRARMGNRAIERVQGSLSWESSEGALLAAYEQALTGRRVTRAGGGDTHLRPQ